FWLSVALRGQGEQSAAVKAAIEAARIDPARPQGHVQLALCYEAMSEWQQAEESYRRAAELAPNSIAILESHGSTLLRLGRLEDAIAAFQRGLALDESSISLLSLLGEAFLLAFKPDSAEECAQRILAMDPDSTAGLTLLVRSLLDGSRATEAEGYAARLVGVAPMDPIAAGHYGTVLQTLGRLDEARAQFKRSIELQPKQASAYYAIVHAQKVGEADRPLVRNMRALLEDGALGPKSAAQLSYGLGKAHQDLAEFETAMSYFDQANKWVASQRVGPGRFSKNACREDADFVISTFSRSFMDRGRLESSSSEVPVFVVGMIRSGTTLAEQILSSHPDVGAAGEQEFWLEHKGEALQEGRMHRLADEYLLRLREFGPGKRRVVDKMPANYALLGLLAMVFPRARFIHMRRHPVDTCLSIWTTPNRTRAGWLNNKADIVFAYRQYLRVMEHWRNVLVSSQLLEVDYEQLVSRQEETTRRMIGFLGLEWNDACLYPQDNPRSVNTPSVWQVRQPVYQSSLERWRSYEPWLGEFKELMLRDLI
ncbi:MAG TPA: sulfotransferase, partial [Fimbriimonas sp.]|nr:sulfotransferase [Fimbriimonas sp.]